MKVCRSVANTLAVSFVAALAIGTSTPPAHADEPETPRFAISRFDVQGDSALGAETIGELLAPFTGSQRDFGTVQGALEALQAAYRERGYGSVQVFLPEQSLEAGSIALQVRETKIGQVRVSGNTHLSEQNVRRALPSLQEGAVANTRRLADDIRVANESPVRQLRAILRPAKDRPDEVDIALEATDEKPWRVFFTADNTGTRQTGRWRTGVGAQHANLFDRDHVATVQYVTAPENPSDVSIYSVGYRLPLYGLGDTVDVFAGRSEVDVGQTEITAGTLEFRGSGTVAGLRYNLLLPRRGETEDRIVFGFDYRKYECTLTTFGGGACSAGSNVAVHPLSLGYATKTTRLASQTEATITFLRNLPGGSNGRESDFPASANARYSAVRAAFSHAWVLGADWQAKLAASGQWTDDALIPGEQFGASGFNTVRGFLEREVASDSGFAFNTELYSPNLAAHAGWAGVVLRGLLFADFGRVDKRLAQVGDPTQEEISSYGIGLRLAIGKTASLRTDYAVVRDAGGNQQRDDRRAHVGIVATF